MLDRCKRVIDAIYQGASMTQQLEVEGLQPRVFFNQLELSEALEHDYTKAQQYKSELMVDQIIDIADDIELDPMRARVRIDTRKWYASKMRPMKYGERVDVNVHHTVNINAALTEARSRAFPVGHAQIKKIDDQDIAIIDQPVESTSGSEPEVAEIDRINIFD